MFCKNCGHNIAPSEKVCPFCAERSGFPRGMTGDTELLAVREANSILGDISLDANSYGNASAAPAPRVKKAEINRDTFSNDNPTTVFSVSEVNAAINNSKVNDSYDEYDEYDNFDDEYDEYYENDGKKPLPFTNNQIMIIGGGVLIVIILIIILLFSKCGNEGVYTAPSSSETETSTASTEVSSQETSSNALIENAVSFTSQAVSSSQVSSVQASSSEVSSEEPVSSTPVSSTPVSSTSVSSDPVSSTPVTPDPNPSTPEESSKAPEDVGEDEGIEPDLE